MKNILVTGGAGFIGSSLIEVLLGNINNNIICLDNFDTFYSSNIKKRNIENFSNDKNFTFILGDITDNGFINEIAEKYCFEVIIHLAAKVGVRPSIINPVLYQEINIIGTNNILELAIKTGAKQFIFASSSSIYGINNKYPWEEKDTDYCPISPYASSKLSCELLGHVYSKLHDFNFISLRFFTVYGPKQRPDLAFSKFILSNIKGKPIDIYGNGESSRDYTYIDDVISAIVNSMNVNSKYELINIGNNKPIKIKEIAKIIESVVGEKAKLNFIKEQQGDVPITYANIDKAKSILKYTPETDIYTGICNQYKWIINNLDLFYNVNQ